ncbi:uncharacterized protein LOC119096474 [Pollicipes pollicipes]|uniref:uncharacterized protein LOC119096474 n=1 Tax=Pollicipes pollicipes TaxID=41117 RepID=UPI0018849A7B|nr:uncharacterized protein LOC119096474 [Pollicipes pollicipes]
MEPPLNYDPRYPATTNYYWGSIEVNMTSTAGTGSFKTANGPPGFSSSLKLFGSGCMTHTGWASKRDPCARNPADCTEGFSFSLWVRLELEDTESMFDTEAQESSGETPRRRYLLSSGGDDAGSPGIALYLDRHRLTALVSTGSEYWKASVNGRVRNNTWNNVGVRWRSDAPLDAVNGSLAGLQLYINNKTEAHAVFPKTAPAAGSVLDPVEVMVGCHRTASRRDFHHMCDCEFDEVAMWTRALPANETVFFLGGYSEWLRLQLGGENDITC